jgi:hypothetical protein
MDLFDEWMFAAAAAPALRLGPGGPRPRPSTASKMMHRAVDLSIAPRYSHQHGNRYNVQLQSSGAAAGAGGLSGPDPSRPGN